MEGTWFTQKWVASNGVEERTKFFVRTDKPRTERGKRAARKASARTDNASRQVGRLLNENFRKKEDVHIVLEYSPEDLTALEVKAGKVEAEEERDRVYIAAQHNFVNFVRRVQREAKKAAFEFRYISVTADIDGKTGEPVRIHHHLICNKEALEAVQKKWRGYCLIEELYNHYGDFYPLAAYLIDQTRSVVGTQRYVPSRNLRQPYHTEPKPVGRYGESEMRVPKGCIELARSNYARGANQYLRYRRVQKE